MGYYTHCTVVVLDFPELKNPIKYDDATKHKNYEDFLYVYDLLSGELITDTKKEIGQEPEFYVVGFGNVYEGANCKMYDLPNKVAGFAAFVKEIAGVGVAGYFETLGEESDDPMRYEFKTDGTAFIYEGTMNVDWGKPVEATIK